MSGEGDRLVLSSTSFPQSRGRVTWVTGVEKIHKNLRRMVVGMWVFAGFFGKPGAGKNGKTAHLE